MSVVRLSVENHGGGVGGGDGGGEGSGGGKGGGEGGGGDGGDGGDGGGFGLGGSPGGRRTSQPRMCGDSTGWCGHHPCHKSTHGVSALKGVFKG